MNILLVKRARAFERLLAEIGNHTGNGTDTGSMAALGGLAGAGIGGLAGAAFGGKGRRLRGALTGAGIGAGAGALGGAGLADSNWNKWESAHPKTVEPSFGKYLKDVASLEQPMHAGGLIGTAIGPIGGLQAIPGRRGRNLSTILRALAGTGIGFTGGNLYDYEQRHGTSPR